MMENVKAVPPPNFGSVARTITKILRLRRCATSSAGGAPDTATDNYDALHKLKLCRDFGDYSAVLSEQRNSSFRKPENEKQQQENKNGSSSREREALEALIANLFASISAVKAAYAQLQVAHSSYDPNMVQSADGTIVAELSRISEMKQSYFTNQFDMVLKPALAAQVQELRHLMKTYKVTTHKLEDELELKDSEIRGLQAELLESERKMQSLEARLHPNRSLAALDALHLSGLNPTHFLTALRYTFKSIRSFVELMMREMESAGWHLDAAAGSIQLDALDWRRKPGHRTFAFEHYVCQRMFSNFHHQSFGLPALEGCSAWDRRDFFDEFTRLKSVAANQTLGRRPSPMSQFCRERYLSLVHPKMESSFFGNLSQRAAVSSGQGFPDTEFFVGFAEMARRVWLLHCLFFSFEPGTARSIFQIPRGSRFSAVYMESVAAADDEAAESGRAATAVGFTVVPGFRLGRTLIQCKVYLIPSEARTDGRP